MNKETENQECQSSDFDYGTWYRSACDGGWYRNTEAAGNISQVRVNGKIFFESPHDPVMPSKT